MAHRPERRTTGILLAFTLLFCILFIFSSAVAEEPAAPCAMLDIGFGVNARMKTLVAGTRQDYFEPSDRIRAIRMADSLPENFVPADVNTVSAPDSEYPVYIFFDNTNDAGVMYFYTEADRICLNPDSRFMFCRHTALSDISGLAGWDSSRVTNMSGMFMGAQSLPDALALRNWDTSAVTDMSFLFSRATSLRFVDVSNWNTGNVTDMNCMFQVGESWKANGLLEEIIGLGSLDVSNVKDMTCMFYGAGRMTFYDIADWNVSKVESMNHMFCDNSSLRSVDLSRWDVSSLKTIYCMFDDNVKLQTIGNVSQWNTASLIDAGGWINDAHTFVGDETGMMDLSGWDTRNLKSASEMLSGTKVRAVNLSGWTFDSITNDLWEGANEGIFYETGNSSTEYRGLDIMFFSCSQLTAVYISQDGLDSFNAAVERGVSTTDMWRGTRIVGFTVK